MHAWGLPPCLTWLQPTSTHMTAPTLLQYYPCTSVSHCSFIAAYLQKSDGPSVCLWWLSWKSWKRAIAELRYCGCVRVWKGLCERGCGIGLNTPAHPSTMTLYPGLFLIDFWTKPVGLSPHNIAKQDRKTATPTKTCGSWLTPPLHNLALSPRRSWFFKNSPCRLSTFESNLGILTLSECHEILYGESAWCKEATVQISSKSDKVKGGKSLSHCIK